MANYITNIITLEKGEYDLTTVISFENEAPIPKELKNTTHDSLAYSLEATMGVGISSVFRQEAETIEELREAFPSEEDSKRIDQGIENIKKHGYATWYSWCIANWGTKWDMHINQSDEAILIIETAWSSPLAWFDKFVKTLPDGVELKLEWADEDFGCNTGYAIGNNKGLDIHFDENMSPQAVNRARNILNIDA